MPSCFFSLYYWKQFLEASGNFYVGADVFIIDELAFIKEENRTLLQDAIINSYS